MVYNSNIGISKLRSSEFEIMNFENQKMGAYQGHTRGYTRGIPVAYQGHIQFLPCPRGTNRAGIHSVAFNAEQESHLGRLS